MTSTASSIDAALVRSLANRVSERLTERVREGEGSARTFDREAQQVLGRQLLAEVLDRYSEERITHGLEPLLPHEEDAIEQAVFDSIFGLGPPDQIGRASCRERVRQSV